RREVRNECVAIMLSVQAMEAATDAKDQDRLWYAIRNVLISAANLSKICWGQGGKREAERVAVRASIGVSDSSPLRPTRFRNHFEHYDERLEDWADATTNFWFIDKTVAVGGVREWITAPLQDIDIFRS